MDSLGDSPAEAYWPSLLIGAIPVPQSGSLATLLFSAHLLRESCPINKFLSLLYDYREFVERAFHVCIHLQSH